MLYLLRGRMLGSLAAELYFSEVLWPDFGQAELAAALWDYARRERRFGGRLSRAEKAC
jgi:undecaprenyl pyrophosphate synthase